MKKQDAVKPLTASQGMLDITKGYLLPDTLQYPTKNPVNGDQLSYDAINAVYADDAVQTAIMQIAGELTRRDWVVLPGGEKSRDKKAADAVRAWLENLNVATEKTEYQAARAPSGFDSLCQYAVWSIVNGYAIAEIVYSPATLDVAQVLARDWRRFSFDGDGRMRFLTATNPTGELLPPGKMLHFTWGELHSDSPYGFGLVSKLYEIVAFKNAIIALWQFYLGKASSQLAVSLMPSEWQESCDNAEVAQSNAAKIAAHNAAMTALKDGNYASFFAPKGAAVDDILKFFPSVNTGDPGYVAAVDWANSSIYRLLLGQDSTVVGTAGALGNQDARETVIDSFVTGFSDRFCAAFTEQVIAPYVEFRFPGAAVPKVWRISEESEDLNERAKRDQIISGFTGQRFTPEYVAEVYGDGYKNAFAAAAPVADIAPAGFSATDARAVLMAEFAQAGRGLSQQEILAGFEELLND